MGADGRAVGTFKGGPVLQPTSHPALTCLCGCPETFTRFSPLPPLFFMSLCLPVLAGNTEIHARKTLFSWHLANDWPNPVRFPLPSRSLSDFQASPGRSFRCEVPSLLPSGLTATSTSLFVGFPVLPLLCCSPVPPHVLSTSSTGSD